MEELLHGDTRWLAGPTIAVPTEAAVSGGISNEEEEAALEGLNAWMDTVGLPRGVLAYHFADPATGEQRAVFDLAWPHGIQENLSPPVVVLLNEGAETIAIASHAGFRCFTTVSEFQKYVDGEVLAVEAPLIDAYPGLENIAGGMSSHDRGTMHAEEIIQRSDAKEAVFQHRAVLISVNRSATENASLYEATRYAWKISLPRAKTAEVILATVRGMIVGAFIADDWLEATSDNFPGREARPGRHGFVGTEAPAKIQRMYVGKRVPDKYRKTGSANPIKYTWRS